MTDQSVLNKLFKRKYQEIIFVGISLGSHPATSLAFFSTEIVLFHLII